MSDSNKVDFGFEKVSAEEKVERVKGVFSSVARNYDVMNDVMSFGLHRLWKRFTVDICNLRPGEQVMDLAGGTADLTKLFAQRVGTKGAVYLTDINADMLEVGRERLINCGIIQQVHYVLANAEALPIDSNQLDCVCIGFGLRNVTDKSQAIREMYRVLKPGGKLVVLEFSKPTTPIFEKIYDAYSFHLLPKLGKLIAGDADSYQYLVESIRKHPDQATLKSMIEEEGFEQCTYFNLTGGIVAVHRAYKY